MGGPILPDMDDIISKIRKMNIEMSSPYNDGYMSWGIKQDSVSYTHLTLPTKA